MRAYRAVAQLLDGPKLGVGQLGATVWDQRRTESRAAETVQVIDITPGRLAVYNSRGQRIVTGADLATFRRVLGDLTDDTRRRTQR